MENKERQIRDLEKKIDLAESVIDVQYENIGEVIFAAEAEKKESSLASGILREIDEIDDEVNSERERINNILNAVERADEIEAIRKSLTEKIRSIEKDNISNYETIGRASFEAFKAGELPSDKYADIFSEIVKTMVKIDDHEAEATRLEDKTDQLGLFDKMKSGARKIYLKNAVNGYYRQLQRQYKKAGANICHSELVMNLEAESVEKAMTPFRENLEGLEKLEKEDQELTSETEKLQGNLEGLGVQSNAVKTVNDIEKHINKLYLARKDKQREAGQLIFLNQKDVLARSSKVKVILKEIRNEKDVITESREEIERCKAEIEIEKHNREIKALNRKINGFEEKISSYSQEADQLKEKIQQAEQNIKKLETSSGNGEEENG